MLELAISELINANNVVQKWKVKMNAHFCVIINEHVDMEAYQIFMFPRKLIVRLFNIS